MTRAHVVKAAGPDGLTTSGRAASPRRGQIVATAARLFREQGYGATTMTDVARACELKQSSLYYWFRQKDDIVLALLALNRVTLDFAERLGGADGSPAVRLYRLLRLDVIQLCTSPLDISEIEVMAEQQPDVFADFWADTALLHEHLGALLREGAATGQMIGCDTELTALMICAAEQGVQHRFRNASVHEPGGTNPFQHPDYEAERIADELATVLVRSVLRDSSTMDDIAREALGRDEITR
jgi:AcrR family transcriptional regulator